MVNNFGSTEYWKPFLSRSKRAHAFVGDMLTPPIEDEAVVSTLTPVNSENAMISLVPKFTNQILSGQVQTVTPYELFWMNPLPLPPCSLQHRSLFYPNLHGIVPKTTPEVTDLFQEILR